MLISLKFICVLFIPMFIFNYLFYYFCVLKSNIMEKVKLIILGRINEIPTIVQFTLDALSLYFDDFAAYKPSKYTAAYISTLEAKQNEVIQIVNPVVLTAELKLITFNLVKNLEALRMTMNLLEGYVVDASGLTVRVEDFGIKSVRKKISSGDVEGLDGVLSILLNNITNNMAALEAADYTSAKKTELENLKLSIFNGNAAQKRKLSERSELVKNNMDLINNVLADIKSIWTDGKLLYRLPNKERAKLFTNAHIIRNIRNDSRHTKIAGTVTNAENESLSKVKVKARPSTEGKRGKSTRTNIKGYYELKGLQPKNYVITFTLPGGKSYVVAADAKTNEVVVVDFKEEEVGNNE